ncbi:peptidoglycan D,D-transpeptidase FtsI family protein [Xanthobacter sp. TB0136]|uniref:peptidoglycan D,D-transpeptidase FtsI family protein n=1 Tax=Xanthobacter sp. TB0136 TaxID=3459177 RepID=UPI004039B925
MTHPDSSSPRNPSAPEGHARAGGGFVSDRLVPALARGALGVIHGVGKTGALAGRLLRSVSLGTFRIVKQAAKGNPNASPARVAGARIKFVMLGFCGVFLAIAAQLTHLAITAENDVARGRGSDAISSARPEIVDRNGDIIAIDVKSPSLFAEPRRLIDPDEALEGLLKVLPDLDVEETRKRLNSGKGFAWIKRDITPSQQREIHRLGLPGIGFLRENRRIYPDGPILSHVIGGVNVDNQGISGLEKWVDGRGLNELHLAGFAVDSQLKPVELSIDMRVQHAMRDELLKAKNKFSALHAMGLVIEVNTGEIIAMVSLPDFDPNKPGDPTDIAYLNRLTTGVFEMGSTFKALSFAMALDSDRIGLNSTFDARGPMRFGKFAINDYHGKNRVLTVPEIFQYSSNIGTAKMVLALGVDAHKKFLKKMGQLDRLRTELAESAMPIVPRNWGELNSATIAFGHGLSVAPLQAVMAVNSMVNGGLLVPPTFLKRTPEEARQVSEQVLKPSTSDKMRYLMRMNAEKGSARKADVPGYMVGGKTGTAEKVVNGRYAKNKLLTSFTAIFPMDAPRYHVLVMLDEPKGLPETYGYATSGWNAAPTAGAIVERIAPMLGVSPRQNFPTAEEMLRNSGQKLAGR